MTRARHCYDIDGILTVTSEVRLPELEHFRATGDIVLPDLEVRVAIVGGIAPRSRIRLDKEGQRLTWREHLGGLVANFDVDCGKPVRVTVALLLAISPHVVYTNLVEPLLRFMLVQRGRMLLHGATLGLNGKTITLSARTDTGKTSTVLRLLQAHRGVFYSDDMVVVAADGWVSRYPKPLTISAHTVNAAPRNRLGLRARVTLPARSRLHSRLGRAIGQRLGELNLPIMAMNSLVQTVCPPPKYPVTDLVDCEIGQRTRLEHLFVIERGDASELSVIPPDQAVGVLMENTEDAYGFPPYARIAPSLVLGERDIQELRTREREILQSALAGCSVVKIVASGYDWPKIIEGYVGLRADQPLVDRTATAPVMPDELVTEEVASAKGSEKADSDETKEVVLT
jgi:dolichol-phosphate mannosyltransferase